MAGKLFKHQNLQRQSHASDRACRACRTPTQQRRIVAKPEHGHSKCPGCDSGVGIELPVYPSKTHDLRQEQRLGDPDCNLPEACPVEVEAPKNPFADPRNPFADPEDPWAVLYGPRTSPGHTKRESNDEGPDQCCLTKKRTILSFIFTVVVVTACIAAGIMSWKMGKDGKHRIDFECGRDIEGPDCAARFRSGSIATDYQQAFSYQPGSSSTRDEYRASIPEWLRYNCYWVSTSHVGVWKCSPKATQELTYHDGGEDSGRFEMNAKAEMHLEPGAWVDKCDETRIVKDGRYASHCWRANEDAFLPLGVSDPEVDHFECGRVREAPTCYAHSDTYDQHWEPVAAHYVQMTTADSNGHMRHFQLSVPNWLRLACQWVSSDYQQYVYGVTEGAWMCGDKYTSVWNTTSSAVTRCDRSRLSSEDSSHCWAVYDDDGVTNGVPPPGDGEAEEWRGPILNLEDVSRGGI